MSATTFDLLLRKVDPVLRRCRRYTSTIRAEISTAERLAVTIRYLATGNSQASLSFSYRMSRSTVCTIVRETCSAIWDALRSEYVNAPSSESDWRAVSSGFSRQWNFPNCLGAIDGKHIVIQAPAGGGSSFYNYKGSHSIVLLAVCDAYYRFIVVDVGDSGKQSDGGVLSNSSFGQALEAGALHIPLPKTLPDTRTEAPFVFIGDEAFPLRTNMLRPFAGTNLPEQEAVFNYRLSRARRIIENSFGILAARWRIFRRPIVAAPDNVVIFTKAAIALHNFLRTTESTVYCPPGYIDAEDGLGNVIDGDWRREVSNDSGLTRIRQVGGNRFSASAAEVRFMYRDYFCSTHGMVSWQYDHVRRTQ